jgi:ATP-dependent helicase/nuclease subunit B
MNEIAKIDHCLHEWDRVMAALRHEIAVRQVHPAHTVVLLPYVQLIGIARSAWMRTAGPAAPGAYFMPRFETTMNWSRTLAGFMPGPDDLVRDPAKDLLTAGSMLDRSGLRNQQGALAVQLMEAAASISALAAAVPPGERADWGDRMAQALQAQGVPPLLEWESRLGRIALAWVAHGSYPTDSLFEAKADLLVLIEGLQDDPLFAALQQRWGARAVAMRLAAAPEPGRLVLRRASDAEDEAEQAAACVLEHVACGRSPLALVAQDRVLTRRVRALLAEQGVRVRDETGWTLSTTRAAAAIVAMLRAAAWDANADAVLDWAKQAPAMASDDVDQLEADLRRAGVRDWRAAVIDGNASRFIESVRAALQAARPLAAWLRALRAALQSAGQWTQLLQDTAGQAVIDALHLQEHAADEFAEAAQRMSLGAFSAWTGQVLEAGSFVPPHPEQEQVVLLPLSQLLGRPMAAVVIPGCDENNLSASPDLPGLWTPAQRALLGLPTREHLAQAIAASWHNALGAAHVDILWRAGDAGESLLPSVLVQQLRLEVPELAPDPRPTRSLLAQVGAMPAPAAPDLTVSQLSASAYEDLRRCPYRFFALRMLRLQESDELDTELGKRDFGNWLHLVLRHFHEALAAAPTASETGRSAMLDQAAEQASADLALAANEFLPFAASWPQVRSAYLQWLAGHEATGARYRAGEVKREMPLGPLTLVGRIDRIDTLADGSALVIDYKTEGRARTQERIRHPGEDTQLAFYGALLEDDTLGAMYLNVAESDATKAFEMRDVVQWRDQLLMAIGHDMAGIADGAALPALGAGSACDYCAARGLCRKDFWRDASPPLVEADHV